jgi:hypothetical protein
VATIWGAHQLVNRYLTGIVSVRTATTPQHAKSLILMDMLACRNGMQFGMGEKKPG